MSRVATAHLRAIQESVSAKTQPIIRGKEIDALSTLGESAVEALFSATDILDDWSPDEQRHVRRFAALRTDSEVQVARQFPALFPGIVLPASYESPAPTPEELPIESLNGTVDIRPGSIAALLTAPHGGHKTRFGNYQLPYDRREPLPDGATAEITLDARQYVAEASEEQHSLSILADRVARRHRTPQTRAHFELQAFLQLCAMRQRFDASTSLLHLDIHGFAPGPRNEMYDLVLGTGHRSTVGDTDADRMFAAHMEALGYSVYLPTEEPTEGEVFAANHPGTLVQRFRSLGLQNIASVQIEINARFRTNEGLALGKKLARDIGSFCLAWSIRG